MCNVCFCIQEEYKRKLHSRKWRNSAWSGDEEGKTRKEGRKETKGKEEHGVSKWANLFTGLAFVVCKLSCQDLVSYALSGFLSFYCSKWISLLLYTLDVSAYESRLVQHISQIWDNLALSLSLPPLSHPTISPTCIRALERTGWSLQAALIVKYL